jgi:hypothetical protein
MALQPQTGYLHSAYQVTDLDEVAAGGEYLPGAATAAWVSAGISRQPDLDYWRDPDRLMFEHYTDGDVSDARSSQVGRRCL